MWPLRATRATAPGKLRASIWRVSAWPIRARRSLERPTSSGLAANSTLVPRGKRSNKPIARNKADRLCIKHLLKGVSLDRLSLTPWVAVMSPILSTVTAHALRLLRQCAQRHASGAGNSGSDEGADAIASRLHAIVRHEFGEHV